MKRASFTAIAILSAALLTFAWTPGTAQKPSETLARLMPHGAMLFLEARDLSGILSDWNAAETKGEWTKSENYDAFSKSHLLLRLADAQKQFAAAAGIPPDAAFLHEAAGSQSAIALYDIGNLEFLYIARIQSSDAMRSALWRSRAKFEPRNVGGSSFYTRTDAQSGRVVAFALVNNYLLLATREDLIASAVGLMNGSKDPALDQENWFYSAVLAAGNSGDLRMVLNIPKMTKSPHFRSYWIERNVGELSEYSAAISDIYREDGLFREERVLLRDADKAAQVPGKKITVEGVRAAADLASTAPNNVGIYKVVANPSASDVVSAISRKILHRWGSEDRAGDEPPQIDASSARRESASEFERQIDEPIIVSTRSAAQPVALASIIEHANVDAMMEIQSTDSDPSTGFVNMHAGVVISSSRKWDVAAIQEALQEDAENMSTQRLGLHWKHDGDAGTEQYSLDGQFPIVFAIRGKDLTIANLKSFLKSMLTRETGVANSGTENYAASVNFSRERLNFAALSQALDGGNFNGIPNAADGDDFAGEVASNRKTGFLAGNVRSLSQSLRVVSSEKITRRDMGDQVFETITYALQR